MPDSPAEKTSRFKVIKKPNQFSRPQLAVFVVIFGLVGFFLVRSFAAAPLITSVEGENMVAQGTSTAAGPSTVKTASAIITASATAKPAIPSGLTAKAGNGSVTLNWTANPTSQGVDRYQVYWSTTSSFSSSTFIPSVTANTYTISGLTNGKTYYFRVSAHNSVGYGPWTATAVSATPSSSAGGGTSGTPTAKPAIPSGLTAKAGNGSVTLNWTSNAASQQVDKYQVYWSTQSSFPTNNNNLNVTGTSFTVSGLTNGTTYYFRVSAHNSVGYGPWTATAVSAIPASGTAPPPPPPAAISQVVSDASASNGKEMELLTNATLSGSFSLSSSVTSLTTVAKATVCNSTGAAMTISVDGSKVLSTTVSSTSLTGYTANVSLAAGSHTLTIAYTNNATTNGCTNNLYVDVTDFYGPNPPPTPAPTVSLSASPSSVTAGSSSTLTWNSANATSCAASGGWSGSKATSGSVSTGALNTTSNYSLTCTGSGGSATASATVTVTAPAPPPPATSGYIKGYYDQGSDQPTDWTSYKQYGFNMVFSVINTSFLSTLKAAGATAWVQPNIWNGCSYSYSTSQALTYAQQAYATGAISAWYVADEPSTSGCSTAVSQIASWTATLHQNFPNIPTVIATYDSTDLTAFKGAADEFALDYYPCQYGSCSYSNITSLAAAADKLGVPYVGVPQAFGGDSAGHYNLPTAAQQKQIIDTWRATNEKGYIIYAFSAEGMPSADWLQNQPSLLSVIQSENAL